MAFGFNNVQKTGDGEAFDGRSTAEQDFDELEDSDAHASWGSVDDDVPF